MIALSRTRQAARSESITSRGVLVSVFSARLVVPLLFVVFAFWAGLSAIPSIQAVSDGAAIQDSVAAMEHGQWVARPAWAAALPGFALGLIGVLGAAWAYRQFQMPDPDRSQD